MLLGFYGDDFTGSTDALEWLSRAGVRTMLFLKPPTKEQIASFEGLQAFGVAGRSRSLPTEQMQDELAPVFRSMASLQPRYVHYKVCSTFDSSARVGSIGKAIEVGLQVFQNEYVPLLVGTPELGRYCLFGNLFARDGIGSLGAIYRVDRHPVMSRHPITPALDGDLRDHLARQTQLSVGLLDVLALDRERSELRAHLDQLIGAGNKILLFDTLTRRHLEVIGGLLSDRLGQIESQFIVGSSAVELALCSAFLASDSKSLPTFPALHSVHPLLVISGSCSSVTERQIERAVREGFEEVPLDTIALLDGSQDSMHQTIERALNALQRGRHCIVHTARGPDDPRVLHWSERRAKESTSILGQAMADIVGSVLSSLPLQRIGFAGGDTSSHAVGLLGIEALQMLSPFVAGAPICQVHSRDPRLAGLQLNLKGGQVGSADYFIRLANGSETLSERG